MNHLALTAHQPCVDLLVESTDLGSWRGNTPARVGVLARSVGCRRASRAVFFQLLHWSVCCTCSGRCLTWQPADGGDEVSVTVPDDVNVQFHVMSSSNDGHYSSVSQLAAAFPTCPVRVQSITATNRSTSPAQSLR